MIDITLKTAYDLFILDRQTFCSSKTLENYRNTLRYFMDYLCDQRAKSIDVIMVSEIDTAHIKEYICYLRNRPALSGSPGNKHASGQLTKRTIRNYTMDLKIFFSWLYNEGYSEDIFRGITLIRAERRQVVPLFADDVARLDFCFNKKTASGCRNYCIVHLMLDAGLRFNEVCTLKVYDVNFDNAFIHVRTGKGSKERLIPLSRKLKKALYSYLYLFRKAETDMEYFLLTMDGGQLTESSVKSLFSRLRRRSGLNRLHPHLLRHTFATSYIICGGSVEMLRLLLGHESIETTQLYMHLAVVYGHMDNIYKLDPILFGLS